MNPGLIKTYEAGAAVNPCRIVKWGASDGLVIHGTDGSAPFVGVVDSMGIDTGASYAADERLDVIREGIALVVAGDTITRGQWVTSDANGKAVAASLTPGTEVHVIGRAEVSAVAGDVFEMYINPIVIAADSGIVTADVTLTTEQILALNATPVELVAAPGALKAIDVVSIQAFLDYNSAAYAGIAAGEDLAFRYTDGSGAIVASLEVTGFLDLTADAYRMTRPINSSALTGGHALTANAALMAHMLVGEIITGNSPLKLRIRYRTVDVAW